MVVQELITKLGYELNEAPLRRYVAGFRSVATGIVGIAAGIGAAAAAIFVTVNKTASFAEEIDKTSQKLGLGVEALQKLQYAASTSGLEVEQFTTGMSILAQKFDQVRQGSKEAAKTFAELKINPKSIKDTEQLLLAVTDKFSKMENGLKKTALARELFGRGGLAFIPFMNEGVEEIKTMGQELQDLNLVMGVDAIKAAHKYHDNLERLHFIFSAFTHQVGAKFIPAFLKATDVFLHWIALNNQIIRQRADQFFGVLSKILEFTWKIVTLLYQGFEKLEGALGGTARAVAALAVAAAAMGLAFGFLNPVTLLIYALGTALLLLYDDFQVFKAGGDSAINWDKALKAVADTIKFLSTTVQFLSDVWAGFNIKLDETNEKFERFTELLKNIPVFGRLFKFPGQLAEAIAGSGPMVSGLAGGLAKGAQMDPFLSLPLQGAQLPFKYLASVGANARQAQMNNAVTVNVNVTDGAQGANIGEAVKNVFHNEILPAWMRSTKRALEPGAR